MAKEEKTNVMRILDQKKIPYVAYTYAVGEKAPSGAEVAAQLNKDPDCVFKTLVTRGHSGSYYVFDIPVEKNLDLKKAAKSVGEKSVEMIQQKDLLPLTGYIHGGCSPVGMKKPFQTVFHQTVLNHEKILVSAGRVGFQIEVQPRDLIHLVGAGVNDIVSGEKNDERDLY